MVWQGLNRIISQPRIFTSLERYLSTLVTGLPKLSADSPHVLGQQSDNTELVQAESQASNPPMSYEKKPTALSLITVDRTQGGRLPMLFRQPPKGGVKVGETLLRDGAQPASVPLIPTSLKCTILEDLARLMEGEVESTSFGALPQFDDRQEVMQFATDHGIPVNALAFTTQHTKALLEAGASSIRAVWSDSEAFCEGNMKTTREKALGRIKAMKEMVDQHNALNPDNPVVFEVFLSAAFECPQSKEKATPESIRTACDTIWQFGKDIRIYISDTTGTATPELVTATMKLFSEDEKTFLATHFHTPIDDPTLGVNNILAARAEGILHHDCSLALTGMCPYIASLGYRVANTPTEDVALAFLKKGYAIKNDGFSFQGVYNILEILDSSPDLPSPNSLFWRKYAIMPPQQRASELESLDRELDRLRFEEVVHRLSEQMGSTREVALVT